MSITPSVESFASNTESLQPMFGDPFGNRGDYSKGFFYAGRRRFLHESQKAAPQEGVLTIKHGKTAKKPTNQLAPPEIFMTRVQKKRFVAGLANKVDIKKMEFSFNSNDYKEGNGKPIGFNKKETSSKKKNKAKPITYIEKFSSTDPSDWIEDVQAGCRIFTNRATGEVTPECPWDPANSLIASPSSTISMSPDKTKTFGDSGFTFTEGGEEGEEEYEGTGALVYNPSEIEDLLAFFDDNKKGKSPGKEAK